MTSSPGAVIAARLVDRSLRQGNTLLKEESHSVSLNQNFLRLVPGRTEQLTAIQPGTAVIIASIEPGVTATCTVKVPEMR